MNVCCPNGCEAAIVCRVEEETILYKDEVSDREWGDFSVKAKMPVFFCERCDVGWTDHRSEGIRAVAIAADKIAREIDSRVLQKIKLKESIDN